MRRRAFLGLLGAAAAAFPFSAPAQQDWIPVVGYLSPLSAHIPEDEQFAAGMRDFGYVEGKNFHLESRFADLHMDRPPALLAELLGLKVDVIVRAAAGVYVAHDMTKTVPIVAAVSADLAPMGLVASLAHPGGNITGLNFNIYALMAKRLDLLKQVASSVTRIGVLVPKDSASTRSLLNAVTIAVKALNLELQTIEVAGADFDNAFSAAAGEPTGALVSSDHPQFMASAAASAAITEKRGLPSAGSPTFAAAGELLGYGADFGPMFRRA